MTWTQHIHDFEAHLRLERNLSGNSVQAYLRDVEHLRRFAEPLGLSPEAVGKEQMNELLLQLNEAGIAVATQCRIISGWRAFFRMLVIEGLLKENPAALLDMPSRGKHLPDVLTDDDVAAMQATLDRSLPGPARNYVIIEVLYGCGLRVSELVNLKLSNIYAEDEMLQIFGKGSKERWVPINARALRLLEDYIHMERSQLKIQPGEEKYVFLNLRGHHLSRVAVFQFIKEAAEKAGIRKSVSPHSLRHTFATELVQNGADLRAVQEMLGHESLSTTEIYTHLSRQFLRETLHTYHPHYKK
ncbi:MAG: tyrosine recombinase [Bacteroidales bacterium]|nr:tyrosine recombinase [Bacteroidales bacterium]